MTKFTKQYLLSCSPDIKHACSADTKHEYCISLREVICNLKKEEYTNSIIYRYIESCSDILCWTVDYTNNKKYCEYIFKNFTIPLNIYNGNILKILKENEELYDLYLQNKIIDIYDLEHSTSEETFINFINTNKVSENKTKLINLLLEKKLIRASALLIDKNISFTKPQYIKLIIAMMLFGNRNIKLDRINTIKKCIDNGFKIEIDTLKKVLDAYDFKNHYSGEYTSINNNHFYDICVFLLENGSEIKIDDIKYIHYYFSRGLVINYLINKGYNIQLNEFIELCKNSIIVDDIKKIKQFFNNKEVKILVLQKNLKYKYDFEYDLETLRELSKTIKSIELIKKITKTITPDIICLEMACLGGNMKLVKYYHDEFKIKFNDNCIMNCTKTCDFSYDRIITCLRNKYNS